MFLPLVSMGLAEKSRRGCRREQCHEWGGEEHRSLVRQLMRLHWPFAATVGSALFCGLDFLAFGDDTVFVCLVVAVLRQGLAVYIRLARGPLM